MYRTCTVIKTTEEFLNEIFGQIKYKIRVRLQLSEKKLKFAIWFLLFLGLILNVTAK